MPLDPRINRFLTMLNARSRNSAMTVEERRAGLAELMRLGGVPSPMERVEIRTVPGPAGRLDVRIYTPGGMTGAPHPGLVYFHGGGFVAGTLDTHDGIARALAAAAHCRIVSVAYRLAPEHRFPAAVDDALASVSYVAAHAAEFGIDPARLGVCGDSAGAGLAATTCHTISRMSGPKIVLQALLCPVLDYSQETASKRRFGSGYLVERATLEHDLRYYLPDGADPADPRISPLQALDLSGLPPTIIHTAEFDPLRDEGRLYFERLSLARSAVTYTCHQGMIHLFYALGAMIPYVRGAFDDIGTEIRSALA